MNKLTLVIAALGLACGGTSRAPGPTITPAPAAQADDVSRATTIRQVHGRACRPMIGGLPQLTDGSCACHTPPYCGGATPKPPTAEVLGTWTCTSNDRAALKPDGCPYKPTAGAPCQRGGKVCGYSHCGQVQTTATCENGTWRLVSSPIMPHPMQRR